MKGNQNQVLYVIDIGSVQHKISSMDITAITSHSLSLIHSLSPQPYFTSATVTVLFSLTVTVLFHFSHSLTITVLFHFSHSLSLFHSLTITVLFHCPQSLRGDEIWWRYHIYATSPSENQLRCILVVWCTSTTKGSILV